MSEHDIRNIIDNAEEVTLDTVIEPPRPLRRQLAPPTPFPIEMLGKEMAKAAQAIHNKIQAPYAICCQSVLSAVTLATQGHGDVILHTGQSRPSSEYFLTIAESGERKTSADTEAMRGIEVYELELREKYDAEVLEYKNVHDVWDRDRSQILNDKNKHSTSSSRKEALDKLGEEPQAPLFPAIICPEPTYEGLCKVMVIGQASMGVFSDEGGQFVGGHGMNEDNRLKTAAGLSSLWDGKTIKRIRSGDGASIIPGRRLSMHLMVQPMVFSQFFADDLLENQGIFSRILGVAPVSTAGDRIFRAVSAQDEQNLQDFASLLLKILREDLPLVAGKRNELLPRKIHLSFKAKELLIKFSDNVERKLAEGQPYHPIKPLANKLAEHAARLAATKALFANIHAAEIDERVMAESIALAEYYAEEALRLRGALCIDPMLALAEKSLIWMQTKWEEKNISLPDIYQYGSYRIGDKATARNSYRKKNR